jgi:lysozyme
MKKYYGNYLGLVVTDGKDDPEQRGRVQIFIPSIMPALYDGWTKEGKDRKIMLTGNNFEDNGLTSAEINKLRLMLPWAECAAPMIGSGPAGHYMEDGTFSPEAANTGEIEGTIEGDTEETTALSQGATTDTSGYKVAMSGDETGGAVKWVPGSSRSQPLSDNLVKTINTGLKGTGLDWYSHSGGQVPKSQGGVNGVNRTGSDRHDDGRATDGQFRDTKTGRPLNPNNAEDKARLQNAITSLSRAGIKGIGWDGSKAAGGTGGRYMGDTNFHIDIVSTGNWGASHTKATGANWITTAQIAGTGKMPAQPVNPTIDASKTFVNQGANMTPDGKTTGGYSNLTASQTAGIQGTQSGGGTVSGSGLYSDNFVNFIKSKEGFKPNSYDDVGKQVSIGYGTRAKFVGETITREEAESRLRTELNQAANLTNKALQSRGITNLTQSQKEALMSFTYNLGPGNPSGPVDRAGGLRQLLDSEGGRRDWKTISEAIPKYNKAGEQVLGGLTARRNAEVEFANTNGAGGFTAPEEVIDNTAIVQNPKEYSISPGPNTNYLPTGMFSYARTGQVVWVFFQGGDPLFPVYFAASYSQTEWQNMYQTGSGGIGNGIKNTWGSVCKFLGGGFRSAQAIPDDTNGFEESEFTMEMFGQYGGALRFKKSGSEFFSPYDHGSQVEGDSHDIVLGNREVKTGGTHNTVVDGNYVLTVGDWSTEAVNAAEELQTIIAEASKALDKD